MQIFSASACRSKADAAASSQNELPIKTRTR
jgi:hypothetical protein